MDMLAGHIHRIAQVDEIAAMASSIVDRCSALRDMAEVDESNR